MYICFFFFFYCYADHRDLHSFPTRRSSDLFSAPAFAGLPHWAWRYRAPACWRAPPWVRVCPIPSPSSCRPNADRSEEHTSELQSRENLVCRLLLEKKKKNT